MVKAKAWRSPDGIPSRFRLETTMAVLLVTVPIALAFWLWFGFLGPRVTDIVNNVVETAAPLAAAMLCLVAGRSAIGPSRHGWFLMSAATLSWALGQAAWTYYEVILQVEVPHPGPPDVGYLLFIPLAVAGLAALSISVLRQAGAARAVLDGAGLAASLLIISWALLLGPLVRAESGAGLALLVDIAYPVGDIILATMALLLWPRVTPAERPTLAMLSGGLLALAIGDATYAYLSTSAEYDGTFVDAAWVAGFLAIGVAAARAPRRLHSANPGEGSSIFEVGFPYLPVLPTLAALAAGARDAVGRYDAALVALGLAWILLIMGRQSLLVLENAQLASRLSRSLADSHRVARALEESKEALARAQAVAGVGSWSWDLGSDTVGWSDEMYHVLGADRDGFPPTVNRFLRLVHPDDRPVLEKAIQETASGAKDFRLEHRLAPAADGKVRWVASKGHLEPQADGEPSRVIGTVRDITESKRFEQELARRESWFRALTQNSLDSVTVLDRSGIRRFVSGAVERVFGYDPDELLGVSPFEQVHPDDRARVQAMFQKCLASPGRPFVVEMRGRRKDGEYIWVETTAVNLLDDPVVEGIITNTRDISDRRRQEEDRLALQVQEQELRRLRELDRFKTEFLNEAAHELKTPLTPVRAILQVLRHRAQARGAVQDQQSFDVLNRNVERFARLSDEILDAARLQAGRMRLDPEATDLDEVIRSAVEGFAAVALQSGVVLSMDVTGDLKATVDRARIAQVLDNLLDNAIKFTPADGRVRLTAAAIDGRVRVEVSDTGAGLEPGLRRRLFTAFSRGGDPAPGRSGTGLGLYICKGIVELHHGTIGCESAGPGKGSVFYFELPRAGD